MAASVSRHCTRTAARFLAIFVLFSAPALAQPDDGTCRNGSFPRQQAVFGVATVTGSGRLHFLEDMDGCPTAQRRCRRGPYVVPGDRLVTGRDSGPFVCAYYPSPGGGTAGWVDRRRLRAATLAVDPPATAWLGAWSDGGNPAIRIVGRGMQLSVSGEAYWPGRPGTTNWPDERTNEGSIAGPLVIVGARGRYEEDGCEIAFTLLDDHLVVGDNMACGGMNVSFSGIYRRDRPRDQRPRSRR